MEIIQNTSDILGSKVNKNENYRAKRRQIADFVGRNVEMLSRCEFREILFLVYVFAVQNVQGCTYD